MRQGELLAGWLRALGVERVFGEPVAGVPCVRVAPPRAAALLADAEGLLGGGLGAAHLGDGRLRLSSRPGSARAGPSVARPGDLGEALLGAAAEAGSPEGGAVELRLALDLEAPVPAGLPGPAPRAVDRWIPADPRVRARVLASERPVMLVGPALVRAGAIPGLHAFATAAQLGVLNTWGAKGVFDWRSQHHLATAGLQQRDFELSGFGEADLIVACGVDPAEAPSALWQLAPVLEVPPGMLDPLAERCARPPREIVEVPLRSRLSAVVQPAWTDDATPLWPSRVTRHYAMVLGAGGFVAADPGRAGFWVARTFATMEPGSVAVPARPEAAGFAVAAALAARLRRPARPVLAVLDDPPGEAAHELLDVARALGVAVPVECWDEKGEALAPAGHLERLRAALSAPEPGVLHVSVNPAQLERIVEVAGPLVAWT